MTQLPGLLKQEKEAFITQTMLVYHQYLAATEDTKKQELFDKFLEYIYLSSENFSLKDINFN